MDFTGVIAKKTFFSGNFYGEYKAPLSVNPLGHLRRVGGGGGRGSKSQVITGRARVEKKRVRCRY
jgi:hypothetical protein